MLDGKSLVQAAYNEPERKWRTFKLSKVGTQMERLYAVEGYIGGGEVSPDMKRASFWKSEQSGNIILMDNLR
jgi:hypothetical protein